MINLPALELKKDQHILYVGVGGGFDIYAALPIIKRLEHHNYTLANLAPIQGQFVVKETTPTDYPESELKGDVWTIGKNGVQSVKKALEEIKEKVNYDFIIAVDGGIDSLMKGDEVNSGTYLEDFIVLAAINEINCRSVLACVGFGTETEEDINHYRALENMAALSRYGYFLGSCSLTPEMEEFKFYKEQCNKAWEKGRKSHIHTKIIPAVEGEFGDFKMFEDIDPRLHDNSNRPYFLSPLMGIYWFFNLEGVVLENIIIPKIKDTNTFIDAMSINREVMSANRSKLDLPL